MSGGNGTLGNGALRNGALRNGALGGGDAPTFFAYSSLPDDDDVLERQRVGVLRDMFGDEYADSELEDVTRKTLSLHEDDWPALVLAMLAKGEDDRVASFLDVFGHSVTSEAKVRYAVRSTLLMSSSHWLQKSKEEALGLEELELDRLCSHGLDLAAAKCHKVFASRAGVRSR